MASSHAFRRMIIIPDTSTVSKPIRKKLVFFILCCSMIFNPIGKFHVKLREENGIELAENLPVTGETNPAILVVSQIGIRQKDAVSKAEKLIETAFFIATKF